MQITVLQLLLRCSVPSAASN